MKNFYSYIVNIPRLLVRKVFSRVYKRIENLQLRNKNLTESIARKNEALDRLNKQVTTLKNLLKKSNAIERNSEDEMNAFWDIDASNEIYSNFGKNLAQFVFQKMDWMILHHLMLAQIF